MKSSSEKDGVLLGMSNMKGIVKNVMPNLLDFIPVGDKSILNWVVDGWYTTLGLSNLTHEETRIIITLIKKNTLIKISCL